jgi:hypothetical protein
MFLFTRERASEDHRPGMGIEIDPEIAKPYLAEEDATFFD